ncbi:MAG: FemAB family XrtA/PEP-CTERM system-associated protein [Woeseiaceae bacterium]
MSLAPSNGEHIDVRDADSESAWNDYVAQHADASPYHEYGFLKAVKSAFGRKTHPLVAYRGQQIVGILPLVQLKSLAFGNFMVSVPYVTYGGALFDDTSARQALVDAAIDKANTLGCKHLELRDLSPMDGLPVRTDKVTMQLKLPETGDQMFADFSKKLRAQIRRPKKAGAESAIGGIELLDDFYAIVSRKYRDLGVPIYGKDWFRQLLLWQPEHSHIAVVRLEGEIVAAGLLVGDRGRMEVPYAASVREHDKLSVNMLLYWAMIETSIERGYQHFDFGRTTPDSGTHRFKRQWGAEPVQLYWHYWLRDGGPAPKLNADNGKFGLAVSLWRKLPVWLANRIGPHIVKNLP